MSTELVPVSWTARGHFHFLSHMTELHYTFVVECNDVTVRYSHIVFVPLEECCTDHCMEHQAHVMTRYAAEAQDVINWCLKHHGFILHHNFI